MLRQWVTDVCALFMHGKRLQCELVSEEETGKTSSWVLLLVEKHSRAVFLRFLYGLLTFSRHSGQVLLIEYSVSVATLEMFL